MRGRDGPQHAESCRNLPLSGHLRHRLREDDFEDRGMLGRRFRGRPERSDATQKYRKQARITNMQGCLNEEIRHWERAIRIFPNSESALRLVGNLLAEHNEVWAERHSLDMDEFHE